MINVGIIGATGYAGEELIDILLCHPEVRITNICAKIPEPQLITDIFPKFRDRIDLVCDEPDLKKIANDCDLIFLALPHTVSMEVAPKLLSAGKTVIDLSADYRLKNTSVYEKFYSTKHKDKENLAKAVYGLPELNRAKIKNAKFIANPGCYPTACILPLAPLVAFGLIDADSIIIDAKSGVTGAGRKITAGFLFSEVNEDFKAYKVNNHQHSPEINQELSKLAGKKIEVVFVPHLLPLNRGILSTIYVNKGNKGAKSQGLTQLYKKFYKNEPFVRIRKEGDFPRIKDVVNTNFCDICLKEEKGRVIIVSAIDNLLKGASGQAVQNMNIMYGFPEKTALL
ncbi:MAG: N-acetyl-gamma-glutamyl-phosphate reductase [Candidatus Omnitrophica bacterium]|nr:N-acetyl-gamma-glutamyl-phosphate reductase [Candidatus Omnitrophota bacterium]MBU1869639.1 N-acetyl-gamma-glutamyl-phosphate reductase [Candidatus Omnitrophota bacterium]